MLISRNSMRSCTFMLICSGICFIPPLMAGNVWNGVVMARKGTTITLSCSNSPPSFPLLITWRVMAVGGDRWSYLFSVICNLGRTCGQNALEFEGRTFEMSSDGSLIFKASASELYYCAIERGNQKLLEKTVLLALVKLKVTPTPPIMVDSTLRLTAQVSPPSLVTWGTWVSPSGQQLYTEISRASGSLLSKLPCVTSRDNGVYTCRIGVHGNSDMTVSEHRVNVTVNEKTVFSFTDVTHGVTRSIASVSHSLVTLTCPPVLGDYVLLYWEYPDSKGMECIFQFDRWRRSYANQSKPHLHLIDPASLAAAGNFSFLLKPALKDGGIYLCKVFLDDKVFSQANRLSVLHGYTKSSSSSLDLTCMYSERSQIKSVKWSHVQNPSLSLPSAGVLGRITTSVAFPVTPETAGQYTCTLYLKNGNSVQYIHTVPMSSIATTVFPDSALPPAADNVSTSSHFSTLSLLLFLIPMIAVAVGVLLWRQGYCITHRSVEQSLSHHSGEVENIYEDPDDLRQTSPQGAVYMDLKTGEMDVYKELDRYDQCCS